MVARVGSYVSLSPLCLPQKLTLLLFLGNYVGRQGLYGDYGTFFQTKPPSKPDATEFMDDYYVHDGSGRWDHVEGSSVKCCGPEVNGVADCRAVDEPAADPAPAPAPAPAPGSAAAPASAPALASSGALVGGLIGGLCFIVLVVCLVKKFAFKSTKMQKPSTLMAVLCTAAFIVFLAVTVVLFPIPPIVDAPIEPRSFCDAGVATEELIGEC